MIVLTLLVYKLITLSLERDFGAIKGGLVGVEEEKLERWSAKKYDKFTKGWSQDYLAEIEERTSKMSFLSPLTMLVFCLYMTFFAFDQIMSVDAHWYSTLFGALYFMSGAYISMAWCGIVYMLCRKCYPLIKAKVKKNTLHDLGKLLFGFGIFWAYMFWSHYLPLWYANVPEHTGWMITRLREDPWHCFAWLVLGLCFIIPFLLGLSRDIKKVPILHSLISVIVAIGVWMMIYILIVPTLYPHSIPLGITDIAIALGFMGAYLLSVMSFLDKYPLIPFGDMY